MPLLAWNQLDFASVVAVGLGCLHAIAYAVLRSYVESTLVIQCDDSLGQIIRESCVDFFSVSCVVRERSIVFSFVIIA